MFEWACRLESYRLASEDRSVVIPTRDGLVVAVADGVGGQPGGGTAAERLIELASEAARQGATRTTREWAALLREADGALLRDPAAGQTTAVLLSLTAAGVAGAAVGDSEVWIIAAAGWQRLTAGSRKPYLGCGAAQPTPFHAGPLVGSLLIATDGLFRYADAEAIVAIVRGHAEMDAAARELARLARGRSGVLADDLAVVLCRPIPAASGR